MTAIKKLVELDYPTELVTEPVLSSMIKKHDMTVNIRRASITKGFGYVQMEIVGEEKEIRKALEIFPNRASMLIRSSKTSSSNLHAILRAPPASPGPLSDERFSRQAILPSVGPEGQKKWSKASALLVGEGVALQSAAVALASVGLSKIFVIPLGHFDSFSLTSQFPGLQVDVLPEDFEQLPETSAVLVLNDNKEIRRRLSRWLRHHARPALFAWPAGSGFALLTVRHRRGAVPLFGMF